METWEGRQVMSTYELLKSEGKLEGKAEVVANLLTSGKFTVSEIANFASVDEDFVRKVRADLGKKR
jgi:hypothetical protein